VIQDFKPLYSLSVKWPSNKTANLGNAIKPKHVEDEPALMIHSLGKLKKADKSLTVAMTDPDAPSQWDRKWSEFCHWIVTGVPVAKFCKCDTAQESKQKDIMSYKPPGPPEDTGFHRYVFIVFEAKNGTEKLHLTSPSDRKRWGNKKSGHGVADWAEENGLIPVGMFATKSSM
jgi:phosphatidylethanolamine-binding protein (PEBP) family uncharacterized protein